MSTLSTASDVGAGEISAPFYLSKNGGIAEIIDCSQSTTFVWCVETGDDLQTDFGMTCTYRDVIT